MKQSIKKWFTVRRMKSSFVLCASDLSIELSKAPASYNKRYSFDFVLSLFQLATGKIGEGASDND